MYLGLWGLDFEVSSKKKDIRKKQKNNKKRKKKYIAYRGLILFYHRGKSPLGGTLANFFQRIFGVFQIFKKQAFMSQTLQLFLVISILTL